MEVFTEEWFKAVVEKLKNDKAFHNKAEVQFRGEPLLSGDYHFKVLRDDNLNKDVAFGMRMPTCDPCWYGDKEDYDVDFIIEAKAGVFLDVISNRMHLIEALRMGAQKKPRQPVGSTQVSSKISKGMGGLSRLVEVVREVSGIEKKKHRTDLYGGIKAAPTTGEWKERYWNWAETDWRPPETPLEIYGRLEG
jgi:hypothetical protein